MKRIVFVAVLALSTGAGAFNDNACTEGRAGEQNPHCSGVTASNTAPEPGTLLLVAIGAGIAAIVGRGKR